MNSPKTLILAVIVLTAALLTPSARAADFTWDGDVDNLWYTTSPGTNWLPGGSVPDTDDNVLFNGASTISGNISGAPGDVYDLIIGDDGHASVDGTVDGTTLPNVNNIIINRGAYFFGTADGTNGNLGSINTIAGRIMFDGDERYENALIGNGELKIDIDDANARTIAWDGDNEGGGGFAAKGGPLDVELNPSIGGPATIYMGYHENDGANPGIENERELNFGAEDADNIVTLLNPLNGSNGNRQFQIYGNPGTDADGVVLRGGLSNFNNMNFYGDGEGKLIIDLDGADMQPTNNNNAWFQGVGELHIISSSGGNPKLQMGSDANYDWILIEGMESLRNFSGHTGDKLVLDGSVDLSGTKVRVGWQNQFNATLVSTGASETMQELQIHNDDNGGVSTATFAGDLNVTDLTYTRDEAVLTVSGSLTAGRLETRENSTVNITGDVEVTSGSFDTEGSSQVTVGGNVLSNGNVDLQHNSRVTIDGNLTSTTGRIWVEDDTFLEVKGDIITIDPDGDQVEFVRDGEIWVHGNINAGRLISDHSDAGDTPSLRMVGGGTITTWRNNQDNYYQGSGHPIIGDLSHSNDDAITSYWCDDAVRLRRGTMNIGSPTRHGVLRARWDIDVGNWGNSPGEAHLFVWGEPGTTAVSGRRLYTNGYNADNPATTTIIGNVVLDDAFETQGDATTTVTGDVNAFRFWLGNGVSQTDIVGNVTLGGQLDANPGATLNVTGNVTGQRFWFNNSEVNITGDVTLTNQFEVRYGANATITGNVTAERFYHENDDAYTLIIGDATSTRTNNPGFEFRNGGVLAVTGTITEAHRFELGINSGGKLIANNVVMTNTGQDFEWERGVLAPGVSLAGDEVAGVLTITGASNSRKVNLWNQAVYEWNLGGAEGAASDRIDLVNLRLRLNNWVLCPSDIDPDAYINSGTQVTLLTYDTDGEDKNMPTLDFSLINADPDAALRWDTSGVTVSHDAGGKRVYLTGLIVEPENFTDEYTWDDGDAGDSYWGTPDNWDLLGANPATAPTFLDKANVDAGTAQVASDQTVHTLEIDGGAVTIDPGSTLSITNDLDLKSGSLTVPALATIDKVNKLTMTGGTLDVTGQIHAQVVSLDGPVTLNTGAVFNATTVGIDGGTTTVANGVTINGDFSLNASGTLAITGDVTLGNLACNGGTFALGGNTLTVGTYRQNGGTTTMVVGDTLLAETYQLNGGNVGFAMTNATGVSTVEIIGNTTTLDAGFTHTYTGATDVNSGTLTQSAGAPINGTDHIVVSGVMNMNDSVTTGSVTGVISGFVSGGLNQSMFEGTPDNGTPTNMTDAAYTHTDGRTLTGVKAGTILTLTDTHSGVATGEIQNWNTFPTYGGGDHMVTAFSGAFTPSETGSYNFRGDCDDWSQMWIDMDDNGVFDAGENVGPYAWHSSGNKDLVAGTAYDIIIMAQEHGGGQSVNWFVTKPSGGEDRINPADVAGNGGTWSAYGEYTGATRINGGGVLNIGSGAALTTASVVIHFGGAINVNDGLIDTAYVDVNGTLRLGDGDAVSDVGLAREIPLTANGGGMIDISNTGGLNRSSEMLIETYGVLKGDLTNLAYSDTPGSGLVTFENRAVLAPTSATGTFPTNGDLGGSKLLYGVLNGTDSVQAGANVEAVGGSTIFAGAYFGAGSYAGGDYSATLTNEAGSGDLLVVVYGQEVKLNGATLASDTGTARFEVLEGGRVTVTGGGFNGNSDIVVTGKYDPVDGSEGNTTGQVIFRVQGNDVLKNGQNIRVDKGVFNTYGTEWPVAPGATATVTIGPLGAMAPMDWGNHDWASDHVRRGTYIFEGSSVLMTNDNTDRLRQSEAKWDISPDAFIALRDNIWTQDIDPVGPGGQYELDNVNWMLGMADQVREIRMGDGRRLTKAWDHNDRLHDNNASIIPSASSAPSSVIFSAPSAGGSLNIDAVVLLGGVDININDQIGTATYYLDHIRNENDLTRTRLAQTGRVEMDGRTIQANNITVRNGFLRLFSNERDVTPTITGDIVVWDDGELEIYFARGEGNDNGPATNAAMVRHQVENDTLLPAGKGLYLDQGSMYRPYYRNFDSSSPVGGNQDEWQQGHTTAVPHVVNQTITVRGTGAVAGGRLSSGDPMTIIRFDEEGGDVNGDNHILFPNIVLEEGAHLGIQRGDVDREELRLGVTLKGNARMERENEEWSFQDVNVETLGQEFTLTVDRDGNGGQYDMYGTVGAGVTLTGVDVHFDFNWGANVEDGAVVANLGNQTPGEPGSDGYIRVFTGSDGNNPITGGTFLVSGNQDMEVIVDDHADTQIVNNFGGTIEFVDNGFGGRAGFVRSRRRVVDLDVAGKVVYANIVIDGAATASIYHDHDTDYNMLRVDTGTGGGNLNAEWGGHDFNLNELTGAGRLHNGIFHVDTTLAPGAGAGTLTVQNLVVEGAANYQMEFDVAATDKVHVDDILTINDGWTLELLSDGGFADPGVEYDVFTWGNSATVANDGSVVLPGTYTLVNTAGWDITSAALNYDAGAKRIYLTGVDGLDDLSWNANDGNWNDGANWSMGSPPVANSVPLVDRTGHIATVANGGQVAFRLTVEAGRVDIDGGDLSITSDVNINGAAAELSVTDGTLNVAGDLNVGGAGGAVTVTANVGLAQQGVANVDNSVNVVANGNLSVSDGGELNTQTLNTAGMTNLIGATGVIGTINITNGTTTIASTAIPQVSATGGVLNTEGQGVENLTVGGTAKVNTTAATTVTDLRMSSGRVLLTGGDLTVTTANLAGGVMNASDNALVVSKKVALSDLNIATSDAQFTLSGADLANDSVARTLTVQGDVTVSSGSMPTSLRFWLDASDVTTLYQDAGGTTPAADGTPVALWKDKSGNGFDVTHDNAGQLPQYDNTTDTLNGLATLRFDGDVLGRANDIGISGNADRTVITVWHDAVATGQNYQHTFHMGNAGTREAYGHSVARTNDGRIGNHYWADGFDSTASSGTSQANIAISTWDGDGGAPGSGLDSWYVNGVFAGTYEIVGGLNTGANDLLLGSRLTPQTEGIRGNIAEVLVFDKVLTADEINNMGGYLRSKWGISAPAWTGGLHFSPTILSTTSVVATESSTLSVTSEPGDPLTLAGIEIAGGKTLIVDSPAIDIQLTNLTLGADSRLKSILTAENTGTSGVAITVGGTLSAGGGSSALGYAGDAEGIGADWYSTSLELTGTATYEWTFTSSTLDVDLDFDAVNDLATGDSVNVFGAVSLADGVEIQLVDGLAPGVTVNGVDVALFWAIEDAVFNLANITVRSPIGAPVEWTWDSVEYVNEEWVVLTNLVTGIHPGDATGDNKVNGEDLVLLNAQWGDRGAVGTLSCDFDNDGDVDIDDFQILNAQWGYDGAGGGGAPEMPGSETPEPATMSLLALGGLLILRRRRKA